MRTLLILGGLVVCVLLVTPSDGDQTESRDGGEKGPSDLREFFGQNEDGKAHGIGSSSAIDQLRFRRQEPSSPSAPRKRKKCPGCFSAIASVEDPIKTKRSRRQEKKDPIKLSKRSRRQEKKQEPSSPSAPRRRKKCPGCFSSLIVTDPDKLSKRERRQEKKTSRHTKPKRSKKLRVSGPDGLEGKPKSDRPSRRKSENSEQPRTHMFGLLSVPPPNKKRKPKPSIKPPQANMYSLAARSTRTSRDTKPKRSKKLRVSGPDGLERKPKSDRPSRRKSEKSEQPRTHMFGLMSAPPPDFGTLEKTPKDEGRRERKKTGRKHSREEKEERKLRKHHHHSHHGQSHHHHHHPEGEKEEKKTRRTGSRSAITSTYGERKELSNGKEVLERMKRQSGKGNRRKEKKDKWTVGSRSPIASLPG